MNGGLDLPDDKNGVLKQFKRVRVVWFCLVSHLLADGDIPSMRIDHYVRLFLSACRRFLQTSHDYLTGDECADNTTTVDTEDNQLSKGLNQGTSRPSERRKTSKKSQATKKRKKGDSFFVAGSNYPSALNFREMIEYTGELRDAWVDLHESYIEEVKRELSIMRHTVEFLMTTLGKLLCKSVFSILNTDNPHSNHGKYTRTCDLRIYTLSPGNEPQSIFKVNQVIVGVVNRDGNFHVLCGTWCAWCSYVPSYVRRQRWVLVS